MHSVVCTYLYSVLNIEMTLTTEHRIGRKRTSEYLDSNQQEGTVIINFLQKSRPTQEVKASDRWYIYRVTHDKLHHVLSEVSLESVVFAEFTVDCVKE